MKLTLIIIAVLVLLAGVFIIWMSSKKKARCTAVTEAKVTKVKAKTEDTEEGKKESEYSAILEFEVGGKTYKGSAGKKTSNKRKYRVGDTYDVYYNPDKPKEFLVEGKSGGLFTGVLLIAAAIVLAVIGIVVF